MSARGRLLIASQFGLEFLLGDAREGLPLFVLFFGYSEFFSAFVVGQNLDPRWVWVFAWPAACGLLFFGSSTFEVDFRWFEVGPSGKWRNSAVFMVFPW